MTYSENMDEQINAQRCAIEERIDWMYEVVLKENVHYIKKEYRIRNTA